MKDPEPSMGRKVELLYSVNVIEMQVGQVPQALYAIEFRKVRSRKPTELRQARQVENGEQLWRKPTSLDPQILQFRKGVESREFQRPVKTDPNALQVRKEGQEIRVPPNKTIGPVDAKASNPRRRPLRRIAPITTKASPSLAVAHDKRTDSGTSAVPLLVLFLSHGRAVAIVVSDNVCDKRRFELLKASVF
jgi:hypothetical protein